MRRFALRKMPARTAVENEGCCSAGHRESYGGGAEAAKGVSFSDLDGLR